MELCQARLSIIHLIRMVHLCRCMNHIAFPFGAGLFADNAQFYADNGVPFVMGTTGGDPEKVAAAAEAAGVYAVVSPQMGKQVRGLNDSSLSVVHSWCHRVPQQCRE